MDFNKAQTSTFYNPGAGTSPRFGGGVYQNFDAPSTTFVNIFSQPGAYNVSLAFSGAAGRENPAGSHGGLLNRQVPMTAGAPASGMMNGPFNHPGEQDGQNNLSPYYGSVINGRGGPMAIPGSPEGQKLQNEPPVLPLKPIKRLSIGTQTHSP